MKIILISLVFNGLDLITGIVGALKNGEQIKSSKLRDGLFKKVGFVFCYLLGEAIGKYVRIDNVIDVERTAGEKVGGF